MTIETNFFPILNLAELKTKYRLYKIRGLSPDHNEFEQNRQSLIQKLSYKLRSPVTVIVKDSESYLVTKDGASEPPSPFELVRTTAHFDKTDQVLDLDYEHLNPETAEIGKRFLQSIINLALRNRVELWSPDNGKPLFNREPAHTEDGIDIFRGCSVRVVITKDNVVGLCVDVKHCYVAHNPISSHITKEEFRAQKLRGANAVYHWGSAWYAVRIEEHAGLNITDFKINGLSLRDYVLTTAQKPYPRHVAELDPTGSTLQYYNKQTSLMSAPAALLFPIVDTNASVMHQLHRLAILRPDTRRRFIHDFVKAYLSKMEFGGTSICVGSNPQQIPDRRLPMPDLLFGNNTIMSERHTPNSTSVQLSEVGRTRLNWLYDYRIGPYGNRPLDQQYFVVPKSVWDTYGPIFLKELALTASKLLHGQQYEPTVIIYNDAGKRDLATQGRAIIDAVTAMPRPAGFGIVMLHETADRRNRQRDVLAAMVMSQLRKHGMNVAVIHSTVPYHSYHYNAKNEPKWEKTMEPDQVRKLQGYLRNVAITKILLTNNLWPFVLSTPLNADMTIGIDVLYHTACFACIGKSGGDVVCKTRDSNQKELLGRKLLQTVLLEILRREVNEFGRSPLTSLVIHRDGRLFPDEIRGISEAFHILQKQGVITANATLSLLEITKTGLAPVRVFDVVKNGSITETRNPEVGTYWAATERDAYLLTTGRAFSHPGTCNPLHVHIVEGGMPIEKLLEDVYSLSCLAWTRPEDCSRVPATIKLADIRLTENAGGYDEDDIEFTDEEDINE